jgi:NAD+ synthase
MGGKMTEKHALLRIDEKRAVERICEYLQNLRMQADADGFILGLSGGIDSSVLAALAVHAVSPSHVQVHYLFDRSSDRTIQRNAQAVADWLGLDLRMMDIGPAMEKVGIYAPLPMRITSRSGALNRLLHNVYAMIFGETPFVSTLRAGYPNAEIPARPKWGYEAAIRDPETALNTRHRYRREVLEKEAEKYNPFLLGAANRTEWELGWFVKDGIDDLPVQPLKGLYKTQIRQLAAFLEVPEGIREQPPSPDMIHGITDEHALGMSFNKLDIALDYLEGGLSLEALIANGITPAELDHVRTLNVLSSWKRTPSNVTPPVDGGPHGDIRRSIGT